MTEGKIKISELKEHPENHKYFDDMKDDVWNDFLQSIRTSGVTNAITIDQNNVVVSGHQRVKACKVLGIEEISYKRIVYDDPKKEIKDLIESNLKQRVAGNSNPIKLGLCFNFLQDYYGITRGRSREEDDLNTTNGRFKKEDLASSNGIDQRTMQRYQRLASLPPEIQDLVESGSVSASTASRLIAKLPVEEQKRLAKMLPQEKTTAAEVQDYIKEIAHWKKYCKDADAETRRLANESQARAQEISRLKEEIHSRDKAKEASDVNKELRDSCVFFCMQIYSFLKELGGYAYLSDKLSELPDKQRKEYEKAIMAVSAWADNTLANMNNYRIEENIE